MKRKRKQEVSRGNWNEMLLKRYFRSCIARADFSSILWATLRIRRLIFWFYPSPRRPLDARSDSCLIYCPRPACPLVIFRNNRSIVETLALLLSAPIDLRPARFRNKSISCNNALVARSGLLWFPATMLLFPEAPSSKSHQQSSMSSCFWNTSSVPHWIMNTCVKKQ